MGDSQPRYLWAGESTIPGNCLSLLWLDRGQYTRGQFYYNRNQEVKSPLCTIWSPSGLPHGQRLTVHKQGVRSVRGVIRIPTYHIIPIPSQRQWESRGSRQSCKVHVEEGSWPPQFNADVQKHTPTRTHLHTSPAYALKTHKNHTAYRRASLGPNNDQLSGSRGRDSREAKWQQVILWQDRRRRAQTTRDWKLRICQATPDPQRKNHGYMVRLSGMMDQDHTQYKHRVALRCEGTESSWDPHPHQPTSSLTQKTLQSQSRGEQSSSQSRMNHKVPHSPSSSKQPH